MEDVTKKIEAQNLIRLPISLLTRSHAFRGLVRLEFGANNVCGQASASFVIYVVASKEKPFARFSYTQHEHGRPIDYIYTIPLTTTACHYGGKRYWFVCQSSAKECGRRVSMLYMSKTFFTCRHCARVTYKSKSLTGLRKRIGVVSAYEVRRLLLDGRWHSYAGKPTKRYLRLQRKQRRVEAAIKFMKDKSDAGLAARSAYYQAITKKINGEK